MPTQEELDSFAERLHTWARERAAALTVRLAQEQEGLVGHSACLAKHSHYRSACCSRCTDLWGDLPLDAPEIPYEAFSDHRMANYSPGRWEQLARIEAEQNDYMANWTPENCKHEFCAITEDNHEICGWCGRDVTDPDFPLEAVKIARERATDYERRTSGSRQEPDEV